MAGDAGGGAGPRLAGQLLAMIVRHLLPGTAAAAVRAASASPNSGLPVILVAAGSGDGPGSAAGARRRLRDGIHADRASCRPPRCTRETLSWGKPAARSRNEANQAIQDLSLARRSP